MRAPQYFGGFVEMLDKRLYAGWGKLTEALRSNAPTTWDPRKHKSLFDGVDPVMLEHFWQAMHSISSSTGNVLARTLDWKRFTRVLDVGGGSGALDIECAGVIAICAPRSMTCRSWSRSPRPTSNAPDWRSV